MLFSTAVINSLIFNPEWGKNKINTTIILAATAESDLIGTSEFRECHYGTVALTLPCSVSCKGLSENNVFYFGAHYHPGWS